MSASSLKERLLRYFELSDEEALELYDELDQLYNELKARYLEALIYPDKNRELVNTVINTTIALLDKPSKNTEDELMLIALLDILATDLHDRTMGLVEVEEEEAEEGEAGEGE